MAATQAVDERPKGLRLLRTALKARKTAIMLVFGFAAGLPYTLLIGTLNAWLGEWEIDLATIGVLSWIGLAYAFKFLWSPLVDRVRLPGLERLGRRRSWLILCQVVLAFTFLGLALSDPRLALGWFALVAVIGAFSSATSMRQASITTSCVAEAKAPITATKANQPSCSRGSDIDKAKKVQVSSTWQTNSQLRRRPNRSRRGSRTRSTNGDQRNLNA